MRKLTNMALWSFMNVVINRCKKITDAVVTIFLWTISILVQWIYWRFQNRSADGIGSYFGYWTSKGQTSCLGLKRLICFCRRACNRKLSIRWSVTFLLISTSVDYCWLTNGFCTAVHEGVLVGVCARKISPILLGWSRLIWQLQQI